MASKASIRDLTLSSIVIEDVFLHGMTNLVKVTIAKKVKTLPTGAFHNRKKLKKVFFDPLISITKIPECCFLNCEHLEVCGIPESVISIDERAFKGCKNLKQIEIPKGTKYVDPTAFDGWTKEQRIYHYSQFVLSDKCQATLIDISDIEETHQRVVTHESDLSIKKYIVTVKGGHVGKTHYIPLKFPIQATSKKEAALIARQIPRVKHHHKDAVLDVIAVTEEMFQQQLMENDQDPFLKIKSKHQQREIDDLVNKRIVPETKTSSQHKKAK
ncbi:MAG: hypothetical protein A2Y45_08230 [Tenericutes bacterium GWC2_34_14]|nr:MAG: hypothetical protein A2Z84_03245 [Tenericutes bacterium GWA2_35_7]OHE29883.1 MAG: hypothetical protein A2Y45_08230 [Tenericutes bacterium GWC2_34_14]OHE34862.1 MAG: hypothetical protein A2012_01840 [Tenericutes bacterium GWE2_34_108]OHE37277.1 MAG: hypothetical protein A2Y46_01170 [Tenericutes bacterium GWF1_35_14]OHE39590.1 MAG: hypothetical protein A2Y44_01690 [Tenericutes bacterium GWF2_35_184]OHE41292.1 MAG: hypothetical protein A3K26_06325 [Tenericutes bacterium RIFOXYA12_FULL_35_